MLRYAVAVSATAQKAWGNAVKVETRNWVIVADESAAEFYTRERSTGPLEQVAVLRNPVGQAKLDDLYSDSAGRSFDSGGEGRHALATRVDKKEVAAMRFADEVIDRIVREDQRGHVVRYSIIAPPKFLGHLRKALHKHRIEPPSQVLAKDLVGRDGKAIADALRKG